MSKTKSPAALGYRLPAEWEPHRATWLSWPHNPDTWPDQLPAVEAAMAAAAAALSRGEDVHVNVLDAAHARHVGALLDAAGAQPNVYLHQVPTNDAWVRDHGAIFVVRDGERRPELAATDWGFNSWGGKYPPWDCDNRVPARMAEILDVPRFEMDLILEGGSIEPNGEGLLLTTESCLLNPNRNPGQTKASLEAALATAFGIETVWWLGDGIVGDDTDGHIDDITRFVAPDAVVTAVEADPGDANYAPLQENLERLHGLRLPDGRPLRVIELPMPRPVMSKGERLPASYANFYIGNRVVLLPVFGDPSDDESRTILARLFPGREVVPIDCRPVVWGLGAFHCLTQQIPAGRAGIDA